MIAYRLKTSRGPVEVRIAAGEYGRGLLEYEGDEVAVELVRPHLEMAPTPRGALGESCSEEQFVEAMNGEWMSRYQPKPLHD